MGTRPELPRAPRGCRDGLGLGAVLHRQAAHGAPSILAPARLCRRRASRPPPSLWFRSLVADRFNNNDNQALAATVGGVSAALAAAAAWLHWRRFHVPITVAAGAAAVAGIVVGHRRCIVQPRDANSAKNLILGFVLLLGIGMFLFAMWWDASDRARAHPPVRRRFLASPSRRADDRPSDFHASWADERYSHRRRRPARGWALRSLWHHRRSPWTAAHCWSPRSPTCSTRSTELFKQFGAVELNIALTALVIGSALLLLSAYWHQARRLDRRSPAGKPCRDGCPLLDRRHRCPLPNQPHEPSLERGQHAAQGRGPA